MPTIEEHKIIMTNLAGLIQQEESCMLSIYTDKEQLKIKDEPLRIARKKTGEEFVVLFMGAFSSGKSSMINALIGEELLPTGFLPETAVIGELHYGTRKRIILYPKPGKWKGGDKPFEIQPTTEEIEKYVSLSATDAINTRETTIDGNESNKIDAKFEKMVVYWPLDILKDGVIFVDSPGINDPNSNDYIVNDYLPNADAIVYVMDSQNAYASTDGAQLRSINKLGKKNIVTGYTFYDIVSSQTTNPDRLQQIRSRYIGYMLKNKHTELGENSIHFLNSLGGLKARQSGDNAGWIRSGFDGFENYLEEYLVDGKGRDQVKNMVSTIILHANSLTKDAEQLNSAAKRDAAEILRSIEEGKRQLQDIRLKSEQTGKIFRNNLESYLPKAEQMISTFINESLPTLIDLSGFTPETELPTGISKLNPFSNKPKAIQEECKNEIIRRVNIEYRKWLSENLNTFLKESVQESTKAIQYDLEQIARDLNGVTVTISGYESSGDGTASNIAVGIGYALLTGDIVSGSMSAAYGKGTLLRAIGFQVGAGLAMGTLMAAGVAISLPVFVGAVLLADIAAILTLDNDDKLNSLKRKAVEDFRKSFSTEESKKSCQEMIDTTMDNVKKFIDETCEIMQDALAKDLENTEKQINSMLETSKMNQREKNLQIDKRNDSIKILAQIQEKAIGYGKSYNITPDELTINI